ncbi:hypothetical protein MRB53_026500 [Persea americana]|uniref:Uncharacterized protein n=1 Tax=Persea americana TaxID=3435 RepID=A0ACC2LJF4_PERAE|nr:hypothetical protein MRB53_026500 [Persea americana]
MPGKRHKTTRHALSTYRKCLSLSRLPQNQTPAKDRTPTELEGRCHIGEAGSLQASPSSYSFAALLQPKEEMALAAASISSISRSRTAIAAAVKKGATESPRPGPAPPCHYRLQLLSAKISRVLFLSLMMKKMGGGNEHVSKMAREKHMEKQTDVKELVIDHYSVVAGKGKVDLLFCCGQGFHKRSASVGRQQRQDVMCDNLYIINNQPGSSLHI